MSHSSNKLPPDGYYWFIPNNEKDEEQPVWIYRGDVYVTASEMRLTDKSVKGLFIPLTSERCRSLP